MLFRLFTLLAVAALAISTWILSSPAHRPTLSAQTGKAELPGYYLTNTVLTDYDAFGRPTLRIEAQRIDQVDHTPEVALSTVRVNYLAAGGQSCVMLGDVAHVPPDGKIVEVTGNVRLQNETTKLGPSAVVHTDALSYDIANAIASTKGDVRIDYGVHSLTARGLIANLKERTLHLESKVNGRFQP